MGREVDQLTGIVQRDNVCEQEVEVNQGYGNSGDRSVLFRWQFGFGFCVLGVFLVLSKVGCGKSCLWINSICRFYVIFVYFGVGFGLGSQFFSFCFVFLGILK